MEDKKSLVRIIGETIGYTALCYPIYSGLSAAVSQDVTFAEKLKDPSTAAFVGGMGLGYFLYQGAKELVKRYKIERRE